MSMVTGFIREMNWINERKVQNNVIYNLFIYYICVGYNAFINSSNALWEVILVPAPAPFCITMFILSTNIFLQTYSEDTFWLNFYNYMTFETK